MSDIRFEINVGSDGYIQECFGEHEKAIEKEDYNPDSEYSFEKDDLIRLIDLPLGESIEYTAYDYEKQKLSTFTCCRFILKINWFPLTASKFIKISFNRNGDIIKIVRFFDDQEGSTKELFPEEPQKMINPKFVQFGACYKLLILDHAGATHPVIIGPDRESATAFSIWGNH